MCCLIVLFPGLCTFSDFDWSLLKRKGIDVQCGHRHLECTANMTAFHPSQSITWDIR